MWKMTSAVLLILLIGSNGWWLHTDADDLRDSVSASGRVPASSPLWTVVGQVNGNRIEFKCVDGCIFSFLSVTCLDLADCRWTLDEGGISGYAKPFDVKKEVEQVRNRR